ncbi:hypothetical protein D3C86_1635060 [compost metagenome]
MQLTTDHGFGLPGFALGERLAYADHGHDAKFQGPQRLGRHGGVGFAVIGAALGMADQCVAHTKLGQHRGSHLAREGTTCLSRHILGTPGHLRARQQRLALGKIGERCANSQRRAGRSRLDTVEQRRIGGQAAVHLPVADDQLLSHKCPL